jgi:hypothetical protein
VHVKTRMASGNQAVTRDVYPGSVFPHADTVQAFAALGQSVLVRYPHNVAAYRHLFVR